MPTLYNPTSPDKRGEPADLRDNRISHIADGKVTLDSLVVDVHIQWVCGKSSVRGAVTQVRLELNVLENSDKGNLRTIKSTALTSAL